MGKAHSQVWDEGPLNPGGRQLEEVLEASADWTLLNNGSSTMVNTKRISSPDISLVSADIAARIEWEVGPILGSDHRMIRMTLNANTSIPPLYSNPKANWKKYNKKLDDIILEDQTGDLEIDTTEMMGLMHRNTRSNQKGNTASYKTHLTWWNKTCQLALKDRNLSFRAYKKCSTPQLLINYRKSSAALRRAIKEAKRTSWRKNCENSVQITNPSKMWRTIGALAGRRPKTGLPPISVTGNPNPTVKEIAETFRGYYALRFQEPSGQINVVSAPVREEEMGRILCIPFTIDELESVLKEVRESTPGPDGISYSHIKHLPLKYKKRLVIMYNASWTTGIVPEKWKMSFLIPVIKPGKTGNHPSQYRPIMLTSVLIKILEKMIVRRLHWYMNSRGLWAKEQSGGRPNRSVYENIARMYRDAQIAFSQKGYMISAFLDLESAFDSIRWEHIKKVLTNYSFPEQVVKWIGEFLKNRRVEIKIGEDRSSPFYPEKGVPQGSVLEPFLFCTVMNEMIAAAGDVNTSVFIDDLAIWASDTDLNRCTASLNKALERVNTWALSNHLKFNTEKSAVMVFTLKKISKVNILMGGKPIPQTKSHKFLGITFDSRLNWGSLIADVCSKAKTRLSVMKAICGTTWGSSGDTMHKTYSMYILPVILYPAICIYDAKKTPFSKLEKIHNMAARIITGLPVSTPIPALLVSAGLAPLRMICQDRAYAQGANFLRSEDNYVRSIMQGPRIRGDEHWTRGEPLSLVIKQSNFGRYLQKIPVTGIGPRPPYWTLDKVEISEYTYIKDIEPNLKKRYINEVIDTIAEGKQIIYTDGSRRENGNVFSGFYVPMLDLVKTFTLPRYCTVYESEATAICLALSWYLTNAISEAIVIATDCKSVLVALKESTEAFLLRDQILCEIRYIIQKLKITGRRVTFVWVPGHAGHPGNERIDKAVRLEANTYESPKVTVQISKMAIKSKLSRDRIKKWQEEFDQYQGRITRFQQTVKEGYDSFKINRKAEVWWHRWRCGRIPFGAYLFRIGKIETPLCPVCRAIDTEDHIFYACPGIDEVREWLRRELEQRGLTFSDKWIFCRGEDWEVLFKTFMIRTGRFF